MRDFHRFQITAKNPEDMEQKCALILSKAVASNFHGRGHEATDFDGTDVLFDEIPTHGLYLPEDLDALGEPPHTGDTRIPRRRNIAELGIYGVCTGSHGHFGPVDKNEVYQINAGDGILKEIPEPVFVARGLKALGVKFNTELLG